MRDRLQTRAVRLLAPFGALWLALAINPGSVRADDTVCEMPEAYGRAAGRVPDRCRSGEQKQAGLCYPRCRSGYDGVGPVCWQRCRSGYHDDGALCRRNAHVTAANTRSCPWYDACGLTFARGCSTCPAGYRNDGCTCRRDVHIYAKRSYGRGAGRPMRCRSGYEKEAGLCYRRCAEGYSGTAMTCFPVCPPEAEFSCGDGICASEERFCDHAWAHAREERVGPFGQVQRAYAPMDALTNVWSRPPADLRRPGEPDEDAGYREAIAEVEGLERPTPAEVAFAERVAAVAEAHGYRSDRADEVAEAVFDKVAPWRGRLDWEELTDDDILLIVDRYSPPVCWTDQHEAMPRRLLRVGLHSEGAIFDIDAFLWSDTGELGNAALMIADRDGDGLPDARDGCPDHGNKTAPGECGCALADEEDRDGDGEADCYGTVTIKSDPPSAGVFIDGVRHARNTSFAVPLGTELQAMGAHGVAVTVNGEPCRDAYGRCRFVVEGDTVVFDD